MKPSYIQVKALKDYGEHKAGEIFLYKYKEGWLEQLKENPDTFQVLNYLDKNEKPIESNETRLSKLMLDLFANRTDVYAKAYLNSSRMAYAKQEATITEELIQQHIEGKITIGFYQLQQDKVKWACLDFDEDRLEDYENAESLFIELKKQGLKPLLEMSGGGKYKCHIWIFCDCTAKDVYYFLKDVTETIGIKPHEIFPKQLEATESLPYGNLVKLPLAYHLASKQKSHFLDDSFVPIKKEQDIIKRLEFHLKNKDMIPKVIIKEKPIEEYKPVEKKNPNEFDEYFNFVINNELPSGKTATDKKYQKIVGINDNILKNLAIWFYQKGYTMQDLEQEVKPIYDKNGWTFADLKGWFNKALKGDIKLINIGELAEWCRTYREDLLELLPKNKDNTIFDDEIIQVLKNTKKPIQRMGQGLHNDSFYFGTTLIWKGRPVSAIITDKKQIFLGLSYNYWTCANCKQTSEIVQPCWEKPRVPKSCSCEKVSEKDYYLTESINPIKNEFGLNYFTEFNDDSIDYQWQTEAIEKYLAGKYKQKPIREIYNKIIAINKKYIEHLNPSSHSYIACWIIGTYCYTIFEQFGRLYNKAERGSGKTKQAKVLRFLCHNPMWVTKGTESSIFRDMEATCGTLIVDNMDKLHEDLKKAMEHYIETGWMKEATYRLTDKETGRTRKFLAYSSMAINNIYGLDENTIDKTFEIPMLKSVNNTIKRAKPTSKSEDWEELRNDMRYFVLDNWHEIQEKYNEITASFSGREFDVVEGTLAVAKMIGADVYTDLEKYVKEKVEEETIDLENNSAYMIFSRIWDSFLKNPLMMETNIFFGDVADDLFPAFHPSLMKGTDEYDNKKRGFSKYIGKIIKSVPMFRKGGLSNGRTYVKITKKDLEQYMKLQHFIDEDGNLLTSTKPTKPTTSTTSTNNNQVNNDKTQKKVDVVEQVDVVEEKVRVDEDDIDFSELDEEVSDE